MQASTVNRSVLPATSVSTGLANLSFALRIHSEVVSGRIRPTLFERSVEIETGGVGVGLLPFFGHGKTDLDNAARNLVVMALGSSALVAEEALKRIFGNSNLPGNEEREGLLAVVYQLRHAFAHNPFKPSWKIKRDFQKLYQVNIGRKGTFPFDARDLDKKAVQPIDVGGFEGWINVLQYCEELVIHHSGTFTVAPSESAAL